MVGLSEFDLIGQYFSHIGSQREDVALGVGDDCALLCVPQGMQLAVSMDSLVCGRHFLADVDPRSLGHKCLAVNLSDLAAMGATPAWVTLALTLPHADPAWLSGFAQGFGELAARYQVQLVGGDTTAGSLSITVQAHGLVAPGQALRRDGADAGDLIFVTGNLGDAALALSLPVAELKHKLDWPEPRVEQGLALVGLASSAIDVSDGLLADLGHICERSGLGAEIELQRLPLSRLVAEHVRKTSDWLAPLSGGDDYELCFTAPEYNQAQIESLFSQMSWPLACIGRMKIGSRVQVLTDGGAEYPLSKRGFDHFG